MILVEYIIGIEEEEWIIACVGEEMTFVSKEVGEEECLIGETESLCYKGEELGWVLSDWGGKGGMLEGISKGTFITVGREQWEGVTIDGEVEFWKGNWCSMKITSLLRITLWESRS